MMGYVHEFFVQFIKDIFSLIGKFILQAKAFRPDDEDDNDSDDDYSDDEELQSPIDEVDPFIFFVDTVKGEHQETLLSFDSSSHLVEKHQKRNTMRIDGITQHKSFFFSIIYSSILQQFCKCLILIYNCWFLKPCKR